MSVPATPDLHVQAPRLPEAKLVILMNAHDGKIAQSRLWEYWCTASSGQGALIVFVRPSAISRLPQMWKDGAISNLIIAEIGTYPWHAGTETDPGYGDAALARVFANLLRPFVYHAPNAERCAYASGACAPVCLAGSWLESLKHIEPSNRFSATIIEPIHHLHAERMTEIQSMWTQSIQKLGNNPVLASMIRTPIDCTVHATWMSLPRTHAIALLRQIDVLQQLVMITDEAVDIFDFLSQLISNAWDNLKVPDDHPVFAADEWMLLWILQSIPSSDINVITGPVTFLRRAELEDPSPICWRDLTDIYSSEVCSPKTDGASNGYTATNTTNTNTSTTATTAKEPHAIDIQCHTVFQMLTQARDTGYLMVRKVSRRLKLQVTTWIPPRTVAEEWKKV